MDLLIDFGACCRDGSMCEKVTDRKKYLEKIQKYLKNSSLLDALDKNTEQNKDITWPNIFRYCCRIVRLESETLKKAKTSSSSVAQSNQEKKKQSVVSFFRLVIRAAERRGHLPPDLVLNHILKELTDQYTCSFLGSCYLSLLQKDVLSSKYYTRGLSSTKWTELIKTLIHLNHNPPATVVKANVVKCLVQAIRVGCNQNDILTNTPFPFFMDAFKHIREERNARDLLTAVNCFCTVTATQNRTQLCRLGEEINPELLWLWNNRPSEMEKDEIVKFWCLQMSAHHPCGARSTEQGAFAIDWDIWKRQLHNNYGAISTHLEQLSGRTRFSVHQKDVLLKENYVHLACEVFHQVFLDDPAGVDVTNGGEASHNAKRRRMESGWQSLRDSLVSTNDEKPWLQVLCALFKKYPGDVTPCEASQFLEMFHQLLMKTKRADVTVWYMHSLEALARNWNKSVPDVVSCHPVLWQKIADATLRLISLHHAEGPCFGLLLCLIRKNLIAINQEMWNIFPASSPAVGNQSLQYLATIMSNNEIPSTLHRNVSSKQSHPFRSHLVDWLFKNKDLELEENVSKMLPENLDPNIVVEVLLRLIVQDSTNCDMTVLSEIVELSNDFDRIAKTFLEISFDLPADDKKETTSSHGRKNPVPKLLEVQNLVEEALTRECKYLGQAEITNMQVLQLLVLLSDVACRLLQSYLNVGIVDEDVLAHSRLFDIIKFCLNKVNEKCQQLVIRETGGVIPLLEGLESLYAVPRGASWYEAFCDRLVVVTPPKLLKQIEGLIVVDKKRVGPDTDPFNTTAGNNTTMDGFDMTMDEAGTVLDEFDDEDPFTTEVKTDVAHQSPLSPSALTEAQRTGLSAFNVLSTWSFLHWDRGSMGLDPVSVHEKILDMFSEENFRPTSAVCLQLMACYIEKFSKLAPGSDVLTDDTMDTLMRDALRRVFSAHQKDTEVMSRSLQLLCMLLPLLVVNGTTLPDSSNLASHLVGVFVKSRKDQAYCMKIRLEICNCLLALVKLDPDQTWTMLKPDRAKPEVSAAAILMMYLKDPHSEVRMMVAVHIIKSLFVREDGKRLVPLHREQQETTFDSLYSVLKEVLTVEGHLTPDEKQDESVNRTSSLLHSLATIASVSIVCQRKIFMAFCLVVKENRINIDLVKKVLLQISQHLGFPSLSAYALANLPYTLGQWLAIDYSINTFPYQLTDCQDQADFYREFQSILVPLLLMRKKTEILEEVSASQQLTVTELVLGCLPKIMINILPLFAVSKGTQCTDELRMHSKLAKECYVNLETLVTKKAIENCMKNYIDEIVVDILMMVHDTEGGGGDADFIRNTQPEPNPPFFGKAVILATFDYLTQCAGGEDSSLVSLLAVQQDGIQKVLLSLRIHLNHANEEYARRHVFISYQMFVEILLKEFGEKLGDNWAFVLRDVIYTLVHLQHDLLQKSSDLGPVESEIFSLTCDVLLMLCQVGVECCPEELGRFLPVIVSSLSPWIRSGGPRAQLCCRVIDLILEHSNELSQSIALLDPFPNEEIFSRVRQVQERLKYSKEKFSLKQEIVHFLNAGEHLPDANCRLEGLNFLYEQLSDRKKELGELQKECRGKMEKNELVQLICTLIRMVEVSHTTPAVKQAAARCLGEIGPVDLGITALLRPEQNAGLAFALEKFKGQAEMERNCYILHKLDEYLTDSRTEIVQAASDVLKSVLGTQAGATFVNLYKEKVKAPFVFYIQPFRSTKKKIQSQTADGMVHGSEEVDDPSLWVPDHDDHDTWIGQLVCTILSCGIVTDPILNKLEPICKVKASFCTDILPYLIHSILLQDIDGHCEILSQQIEAFFTRHGNIVERESSRITTPALENRIDDASICQSRQAVECLLNLVQYLRQQPRPVKGRQLRTAWENNFWLNLDYLVLAKAAQSCGKHFTALMFAEIWCSQERIKQSQSRGSQGSQLSEASQLSSLPEESRSNVQTLLLEAYRDIGDPDGVYGCGISCLGDTFARTKMYEHEEAWEKALWSYDLEMDVPRMTTQLGLLNSLQSVGSSHVLDTYLKGLDAQSMMMSNEFNTFQYEAALRCGKWNMEVPSRPNDGLSFSQAVYWSCSCLLKKDAPSFFNTLEVARNAFIGDAFTLESATGLYHMLSKLQCVNQVENIGEIIFRGGNSTDCLEKWETYQSPLENDFSFTEPILQTRTNLLNLYLDTKADNVILDGLQSQTELLVQHARDAGRYQVALHAIHRLEQACKAQEMVTTRLEEAKLFWAKGETNTAMYMMNECLKTVKQLNNGRHMLYAQALTLYGEWLAKTHTASPQVIMEENLQKSVDLIEGNGDAHVALAKFADAQYQSIVNYMKSGIYESRVAARAKANDKAQRLRASGDIGPSDARFLRFMDKNNAIEDKEEVSMLKNRTSYLLKAVENYIRGLCYSDDHDLHVVRLISLWFDNPNQEDVCKLIDVAIKKLKSHKFIPLMYQLAARMAVKEDDLFQDTLQKLIFKTSVSHPYHTFFIILALYHANKDEEFLTTAGKSSSRLSRANSSTTSGHQEERVLAAKDMVQRLLASPRAEILHATEKVCAAYIQLANMNAEKHKGSKSVKIPHNLLITQQARCLPLVAMPSMDIPVEPDCRYEDVVHITGFQPTFGLVGGINLPKLVTVLSSDGVRRRQLVKGKDDLRQDAVMQQVFSMVNTLLGRDPEARKRNLAIRRYKVVPFSKRSGVLEWCEDTQPLLEILIGSTGKTGAHAQYRPRDWDAIKCRDKMRNVAGHTYQERLDAFQEVCKRFMPVFRYFFMEKFPQPAVWYEKRMAYTRSVATNSIVGYILGLGDRHLSNILIDCNTAELVHIDLGVAFEQGKVLPTPETVPFRLTRDIVDGMGVSGVEGTFRRSCEKTMEVMRQNQEALLTILQVLLYDPLYQWTMSPVKAYQLQQRKDRTDADVSVDINTTCELPDIDGKEDNTSENTNELAERVLLRLRQKLQGLEDGIQRSVMGQVNMLVQEAIDPHNLSRLYPGWQPYV